MTIPESSWIKYINMLSAISKTAARKFTAYLNNPEHDVTSKAGRKAAIDYAAALADSYGESAAAVACQMYDAVADASKVALPPAVPAAMPTYGEVAKAVNGMLKHNYSNDAVASSVGRLVKRTGADTTLQNALRDGAEFAWVPHGDTCSFCIMLASNGWQKASKKTIKGDHAEHIHANCDCTFAVRFDGESGVKGYNPDKYREIYDNAEGSNWKEKLRSMERDERKAHKNEINARKRELYELHKDKNKQPIVTDTPKKVISPTYGYKDVTKDWFNNATPNSHPIADLKAFIQDGVTYTVDGKAVQFNYSDSEKRIAELLRQKLGGEIYMMPKVNNPEGVETPDYLFRGERYDLKTIKSSGKDALFNAIHKKRKQANSFIVDYTQSGMSREEITKQAAGIFNRSYVSFVDRIVIVNDETIEMIMERQ